MAHAESGSTQTASWNEILTTARTYQYDRYLAATLSPRQVRDDLIVLAAFAGEMDRIPWSASEPTIGAIRLQWWRDALSTGDAQATGNPLADKLHACMARHHLPIAQVLGYIDAQELELYSDPVPDLAQLNIHFTKRDGTLFALAARILGGGEGGNRHAAVADAAQSYGLAKTLAEFSLRRRSRQLLLPDDHLRAAGVDPAEPERADAAAVKILLGELAEQAEARHEQQEAARAALDRATRTAILPAALTPVYLDHVRRQLDAAKPSDTGPAPLKRAWSMLLAYLRGRF